MADPEPPSDDGGTWAQAREQLSDLAGRARARLRAVRDGAGPALSRVREVAVRGNARLRQFAAWTRPHLQALRPFAARVLMLLREFAAWALARLRHFAGWARPHLQALRPFAARVLMLLREFAAWALARLRQFAAWTRPHLQALRPFAARVLTLLREFAAWALARLHEVAGWARPHLQALRPFAARVLALLREFAAWALARLRQFAAWASPRLRALRDLIVLALRRLRALIARLLVWLRHITVVALRALRRLIVRALRRLPVLAKLLAEAFRWVRAETPAAAIVLVAIVTLSFLMFVLTEPAPRWILLLGVLAAALGTHGVLRSEHPRPFELGADSTPQLVLPALYALAIPLFIDQNARGLWVPLSAIAAGLGFAAIVVAELRSVREFAIGAAEARLVLDVGAYLTAFTLLSLLYTRDPSLPAAVATAALVGGLLSFEVLRNSSLGLFDMLTFALVGALVIGELRWALHFVPLDGHLAAVALLLAFFFVSGVLAARLRGQLSREVLVQYSALAAIGAVIVTAARAADLA